MTLAGSAVGLRVLLLPTVWYQMRETRRLVALRPHFDAIRRRCASIESPRERALAYAGGVWRRCREEGVQPLAIVALPIAQIPALLGLVLAMRRMLDSHAPLSAELSRGGVGWFSDLTAADATLALPVFSLLLMVGNLQSASATGPVWLAVRNTLQAIGIVALPIFAELPAGVFM